MYRTYVNVYVRPDHTRKTRQLAGMLRGLANSYDGYGAVAGLYNDRFRLGKKVRFQFSTATKALRFKCAADATMGRYIKIKRVLA